MSISGRLFEKSLTPTHSASRLADISLELPPAEAKKSKSAPTSPVSKTETKGSDGAEKIKEFIYQPHIVNLTIKDFDIKTFSVFYIGCQGDGQLEQKKVAQLMNEVAKGRPPTLIFILGDNAYHHGIQSRAELDVLFHQIYQNAKNLSHLFGIPCFPILGNHCFDIHKMPCIYNMRRQEKLDFARAEEQILYTFTDKITGAVNPSLISLYQQKEIDPAQLPVWNMLCFNYLVRINNLIEFYCIDSNNFVAHSQKAQTHPDDKNPAVWLEKTFKELPDIIKILNCHQPVYTDGKRKEEDDASLYLNQSGSYTQLFYEAIKKFRFDHICCAHDHYLAHHVASPASDTDALPLSQSTVGGGGAELHDRRHYGASHILKNPGFMRLEILSLEKHELLLDYFTLLRSVFNPEHDKETLLPGPHLQFRHKSMRPIRHAERDEAEAKILKQIVLAVCDQYIRENPKPRKAALPYTGGFVSHPNAVVQDVICVDDLKNYFNQIDGLKFEESINYLKHATRNSGEFVKIFNELLSEFNVTFAELITSPRESLVLITTAPVSEKEANASQKLDSDRPKTPASKPISIPGAKESKKESSEVKFSPGESTIRVGSVTQTVIRNFNLFVGQMHPYHFGGASPSSTSTPTDQKRTQSPR